MIIPVRCTACGKIIGNMWQKYNEYIKNMTNEKALDKLGLVRYCCRRMLLSHVEIIDDLLERCMNEKSEEPDKSLELSIGDLNLDCIEEDKE